MRDPYETVNANELGGPLDCIVNNAGITKDNLLMRMSEDDFDKLGIDGDSESEEHFSNMALPL